ncbi:hypothetical protein HNR00_000618 [Methylorubrum rhodinum]|uniref:Uncharacterized protein n=1 Tax=Methylorubrum rhodinum TaxID=29428 RepID=A0A840ZDF2_9HYPH|nr:hypothetical protein [Methylorubrum rhodinum]MBB5755922.1 hypothetical protein [Methylorubrum rhodinum]
MRPLPIALALALGLSAAPALAQSVPREGTPAVPSPPSPKASATGDAPVTGPGTAGTPNRPAVVGGTPGAVIGGTPTSGPPGTGGAAGGPSISGQ